MFGSFGKRKGPRDGGGHFDKAKELEETAKVYAEFVRSFQPSSSPTQRSSGGGFSTKQFVRERGSQNVFRSSAGDDDEGLYVPPVLDSNRAHMGSDHHPYTVYNEETYNNEASSPNNNSRIPVHYTRQSSPSGGDMGQQKPPSNGSMGLLSGGSLSKSQEMSSFHAVAGASPVSRAASVKHKREIDSVLEEMAARQSTVGKRKGGLDGSLGSSSSSSELNKSGVQRHAFPKVEDEHHHHHHHHHLVEDESTNLYIGSLDKSVTENDLCREFGRFGPISSVKIMYPRSSDELSRGSHCGFVSFCKRDHAEAARAALDGAEINGMAIRIGWGKALPRHTGNSSILASMVGTHCPLGGPSGVGGSTTMASAAGPHPNGPNATEPLSMMMSSSAGNNTRKIQNRSTVQIVEVPEETLRRQKIDLVAKFVYEYGHKFEQALIERERNNDEYRFIVDHTLKDHTYYLWRVYSYAQGDSDTLWRTEPFFIFKGGKQWIPPPQTNSKPPEVVPRKPVFACNPLPAGGSALSIGDKAYFETVLSSLTRARHKIRDAMMFAIEQSESSNEISDLLVDAILDHAASLDSKVARFYLLSDILYNTFSLRPFTWTYRVAFEKRLPIVFEHFSEVYRLCGTPVNALFRARVVNVLKVWDSWAIFPCEYLLGLEAALYGHEKQVSLLLLKPPTRPCGSSDDEDDPLNTQQGAAAVNNTLSEPVRKKRRKDGFIFETGDMEIDNLVSLGVCESQNNKSVDGVLLDQDVFELLVEQPVWLRKDLLKWSRLRLDELQKLCSSFGVSNSGTDDLLIDRLKCRAAYIKYKESLYSSVADKSSGGGALSAAASNLDSTNEPITNANVSPIVGGTEGIIGLNTANNGNVNGGSTQFNSTASSGSAHPVSGSTVSTSGTGEVRFTTLGTESLFDVLAKESKKASLMSGPLSMGVASTVGQLLTSSSTLDVRKTSSVVLGNTKDAASAPPVFVLRDNKGNATGGLASSAVESISNVSNGPAVETSSPAVVESDVPSEDEEDIFGDVSDAMSKKNTGGVPSVEDPVEKLRREKTKELNSEMVKLEASLRQSGMPEEDIVMKCDERRLVLTERMEKVIADTSFISS